MPSSSVVHLTLVTGDGLKVSPSGMAEEVVAEEVVTLVLGGKQDSSESIEGGGEANQWILTG
jgi:hypothetical protein